MRQTRHVCLKSCEASADLSYTQLVTMMFENVDYLTKKATFKQVSPDMPVTQEIPDSEDPVVYEGTSSTCLTSDRL